MVLSRILCLILFAVVTISACSVEPEDVGPHAEIIRKAKDGDVESMLRLADIHKAKGSTEEDKKKAIKWLRMAAEQGSLKAQWGMAVAYEYRQGFYDGQEAAKWLHEAAEQGHIGAQKLLAYWHSMGNPVEESPAESRKWYIRAAEQGDVESQVHVGGMFYTGRGGEENLEKSLYWYSKAAKQGDRQSQLELGVMYSKGEGVEKNNTLAYVWFQMAFLSGDTKYAAGNIEYIKGLMSEDQILEAEVKAKHCLDSDYQDC